MGPLLSLPLQLLARKPLPLLLLLLLRAAAC